MEAKKDIYCFVIVLFCTAQIMLAQNETEKHFHIENNPIYFQAGLNLSIPAHDDLLRTHILAVGINMKIAEKIAEKLELGVRVDYDYRFARKNITDSTSKYQAAYHNFSMASIKAGIQFNLRKNRYWGVETGIGFVFSDSNNKTGFGFVEEYDGNTRIGSCSDLYFGKHLSFGVKKNIIDLSLNWSNFFAEKHAENFVGIKLNYNFNKTKAN